MDARQTIDRNRETMRLFEKCINTNDLGLVRKLIAGILQGIGALP